MKKSPALKALHAKIGKQNKQQASTRVHEKDTMKYPGNLDRIGNTKHFHVPGYDSHRKAKGFKYKDFKPGK